MHGQNGRENDEQLLVRIAVQQARLAMLGSGPTSPNHTPPAGLTTGTGTDNSTIHVAIYNVDSYNDPDAIYYNPNA